MQDNIAVDSDFDGMPGERLGDVIDENTPGEVRLWQTVVLQDLLAGRESPQQFLAWLHQPHAEICCELANLDMKILEGRMKCLMK